MRTREDAWEGWEEPLEGYTGCSMQASGTDQGQGPSEAGRPVRDWWGLVVTVVCVYTSPVRLRPQYESGKATCPSSHL